MMTRRDAGLPPFRREIGKIDLYRVKSPPHRRKLNQNESVLELPEGMRTKIQERLAALAWRRYPDYPATRLTRRIARAERLPENRVLVGHASNELMYALALTTLERGRSVLMPSPSYPVAELAARLAGGTVQRIPLGPGFRYDADRIVKGIHRHRPRLVFLPSPNNPTGSVLERKEVDRIAGATRSLVVIDEAYQEYADVNLRPLLARHRNLVLMRTLSKAYRIAALRVGYLLGDAEVLSHVERGKPPHSIDLLGQIAGEVIFEHPEFIHEEVRRIREQRDWLAARLTTLPGVTVYPSQANFLLVRVPDSARIHRALLRGGCLVRPVGDGKGRPARLRNCLRISLGTASDNRAVVRILSKQLRGLAR